MGCSVPMSGLTLASLPRSQHSSAPRLSQPSTSSRLCSLIPSWIARKQSISHLLKRQTSKTPLGKPHVLLIPNQVRRFKLLISRVVMRLSEKCPTLHRHQKAGASCRDTSITKRHGHIFFGIAPRFASDARLPRPMSASPPGTWATLRSHFLRPIN